MKQLQRSQDQSKPSHYYSKATNTSNNILQNIESKIQLAQKLSTKQSDYLKLNSQFQIYNKENDEKLSNSKQQYYTTSNNFKQPFCKITKIIAAFSEDNSDKQSQKPPKRTLNLNELCNQDVSMGHFKLESILGHGSYATVRLCVEKNNKTKYAIKIYDKSKLNDTQKMNNIKREISILKRINHHNIIKLIYAIEDKKSINLVMEYISNQSLAAFVKAKTKRALNQNEGLYIFEQLAKAIKYLHDKNIAHRDIKMENILLMTDNYVKLIDFGFSICIPENQKVNVFCGTPSYMSPEIVGKIPHNPLSSDIWSLGILLYRMLTGEYPFRGQNDKELFKAIQFGKLLIPAEINENIVALLRGCLEKKINSRFSIDQILQNPLFQQTVNIYAFS